MIDKCEICKFGCMTTNDSPCICKCHISDINTKDEIRKLFLKTFPEESSWTHQDWSMGDDDVCLDGHYNLKELMDGINDLLDSRLSWLEGEVKRKIEAAEGWDEWEGPDLKVSKDIWSLISRMRGNDK